MDKTNFTKELKQTNLAKYRFQDLAAEAIGKFNISPKWQGAIWGTIARWKKAGMDNPTIEYRLEKAIKECENLDKPAPNFIFRISKLY